MSRKMIGTLTLGNSDSMNTSIFPMILYKSCVVSTLEHLGLLPLKNYVRIVAFAFNLRTISFHDVIESLYHSTTIELLSLLILIKEAYSSLRALSSCDEIVINLVAAVARKLMQGRHAGRYL